MGDKYSIEFDKRVVRSALGVATRTLHILQEAFVNPYIAREVWNSVRFPSLYFSAISCVVMGRMALDPERRFRYCWAVATLLTIYAICDALRKR